MRSDMLYLFIFRALCLFLVLMKDCCSCVFKISQIIVVIHVYVYQLTEIILRFAAMWPFVYAICL